MDKLTKELFEARGVKSKGIVSPVAPKDGTARRGDVSRVLRGIPIGKKWMVTSDGEQNIILQKGHINKETDAVVWKVEGYFGTITEAVNELINRGVKATYLADLKTVCDKMVELREDILGKIDIK